MKTGFVKWFDEQMGYGFISGDDGTDYFVHFTNIVCRGFKSLIQEDRVTFDIGDPRPGKSGPQAINVRTVQDR